MLTLDTPIINVNRVGQTTAKRLVKIGIMTVRDLLFYFPYRYDDYRHITNIDKLIPGTNANIIGQIELIQNRRAHRRRMYITEALVNDNTDTIKVVWFNQPFIAKNLKVGDRVSLAGKITGTKFDKTLVSPVYEKFTSNQQLHTNRIVPYYHLTANITQKQIRFLIKQVIFLADRIVDWLPDKINKSQQLFNLGQAIKKIHFPDNFNDIAKARTKLAFAELFLLQIQALTIKNKLQTAQAEKITFFTKETKDFVNSLPFILTNSQRQTAWQILQDLNQDKPMSRLLEGDVGSGKTLVAVIAMLNVALNKKQAVLMAPTEILARQHFQTVKNLLSNFNFKIGLVTSSDKQITNFQLPPRPDFGELSRTELGTKAITNDQKNSKFKNLKSKIINHKSKINSQSVIKNSDIIIGTHALIQENVRFDNLALAIIDEQHRFGVEQRATLLTRTIVDFTRTDADHTTNGLLYEELSYKIRGAIFNVKKQLGLGHKENIYQKALREEITKMRLAFNQEKTIDIKYDNKKIGTYRPDFIIEDKIILELKALPFIGKFEKQQVWHYLKGSDYQLALLVNFGREDISIERIVHSSQYKSASSQQKFASSPRQSASSPKESVFSPHLLSMTATPIPRTLALTLYGELDLSIIREMPKDRKKIITKLVSEDKRNQAYDFIRQQIKNGRQIFVICPLIDISDKLGVKSVKEEFAKLDKYIFPDIKIGLLHGQLKPKEKEDVMNKFLKNEIKILVATSVIEVGVDVPNATMMMIEGAERFGLAQLHQFRGRVGRSDYQSYCFLFTDNLPGESSDEPSKTLDRLKALENCYDGFALAKMDLKFRGPGEIYGIAQKGFPELKVASLFDYALIKKANEEAIKLLREDPELSGYPRLKAELSKSQKEVHLE